MAHSAPGRVVLALRPTGLGHRLLHQRLHDGQAGTDSHSQQAFSHRPGNVFHRHAHALRQQYRRVELVGLVVVHPGGPLALGCLGRTPETYQMAGLERGTATSRSTISGTTSRLARPRIWLSKGRLVGLSARSAEHFRDWKHGVAGFGSVPTLPEQHLGQIDTAF